MKERVAEHSLKVNLRREPHRGELVLLDAVSVEYHLGWLGYLLLNKELFDLLAVVTLELNDFAKFGVVDDGSVATELFLESLQQLVQVHFFGETLDGTQRLPAVALLHSNVHFAGCTEFKFCFRFERICARRGRDGELRLENKKKTRFHF